MAWLSIFCSVSSIVHSRWSLTLKELIISLMFGRKIKRSKMKMLTRWSTTMSFCSMKIKKRNFIRKRKRAKMMKLRVTRKSLKKMKKKIVTDLRNKILKKLNLTPMKRVKERKTMMKMLEKMLKKMQKKMVLMKMTR